MENKAHPHSESMLLYAQDAMETDKPWELWETRLPLICDEWDQLSRHPAWHPDAQYRRKPRVRSLNGFEYPEPEVDAPEAGTEYWFPQLVWGEKISFISEWNNEFEEIYLLRRGMVHLSKEAAEAHARAIILAGGGEV